jgi:Tfp pilus assembly protein PilF
MRRFRGPLSWAALSFLLLAAVPDRAADLRWRGLAELENERPAEAEAAFQALARLAPDDPLPDADLAVALLRQQKGEAALAAIDRALGKAPGRADLLAIRGEVLAWSGREDEALTTLGQAMRAAPDDPEILYAAYRQASVRGADEPARALAARALGRLAELRPENLVVLLQAGGRAIAAGDRAGATAAYLRVREILWAPPAAAAAGLVEVLAALERGDVAAARVPALRLENVLKVTPMYQGSQRELTRSILGVPVVRFRAEPPPAEWGPPAAVSFRGERLDATASAGAALAVADFDGDGRMDVARLRAGAPGTPPSLEIRLAAAGGKAAAIAPAPGIERLLAVDLDNDGAADLVGYGPGGIAFWKGDGKGGFVRAPAIAAAAQGGAGGAAATAAASAIVPFDFDVDGDLDLAVAGGGRGIELLRNPGSGPLEPVDGKPFAPLPGLAGRAVFQLVASDLDRDGDLDLLVAHDGGLLWLENLRQGRFADRTAAAGLGRVGPARAVVAADLDDDGLPDLAVLSAGGDALSFWHNAGGRFEPWKLAAPLPRGARFASLVALDADNDGRLDLALAGESGVVVLGRRGDRFEPLAVAGAPAAAAASAAADLDGDGGVDLLVAGPAGLHRLMNAGGKANHWLAVRLRGLAQGNGKNNLSGLGAVVEVRAGDAYQLREVDSPLTHFGLGRQPKADLLRVVWGNGVPQDRLAAAGDRTIVEQQVLKGSCPFLYAWDGERMRFVTDLLWNAPLGLPIAPGVYAPADPGELVRIDGAEAQGGRYRLAVTEELWEAAFFDRLRLWVVDAPAGVEVASNLKVVPGGPPGRRQARVLASRGLRPVAAAWDGQGQDVTDRVRRRDEVYADGYRRGPYQGIAAPWAFTFDLGEAPGRPIRLHLDGWIFPADASLNLAAAQRRDLPYVAPRLEVETAAGWRVLMPAMGHPAGKTKTMVVDTPPLPPGARRLRIVTSLWLSWDRIAWTDRPDDGAAVVRARLDPTAADLRYRGFSRLVRRAPNAPHGYDYERVAARSPWLPLPGRYTRYGDVRELLRQEDDRSVILAAGDEIALAFDAGGLPAPPPGMRRTVFLESVGWDKDADRNTWQVEQVEPLPFHAMSGYPGKPGEVFPSSGLLRDYRNTWLTREVEPAPPIPRRVAPGSGN